MKIDAREGLKDEKLQIVIDRSNDLLKERDRQRKDKALEQARTLLAAVGLSLNDVARKAPAAKSKAVYHAGHQYKHPANKALTYPGRGKKPSWLNTLEAEGGKGGGSGERII